MCAVSMISDFYGQFPKQDPEPIPWGLGLPTQLPWNRESVDELKEIIKRLDALDKKLGLEHCEDPKKAEWMKGIEERLAKLEGSTP